LRKLVWIGTDEAGYGPNLGPLCIGGSRFELKSDILPSLSFEDPNFLEEVDQLDWHQQWEEKSDSRDRPIIADSKKAYSSGDPLGSLQKSVSSLFAYLFGPDDYEKKTLPDLLKFVSQGEQTTGQLDKPYWLKGRLKGKAEKDSLPSGDPSWWSGLWFQPTGASVQMIGEKEFNDGLKRYGNKASLLSLCTLRIVKQLIAPKKGRQKKKHPLATTDFLIDCDRHGGRKKYLPLLLEVFEADWIETRKETKECSVYYWETQWGSRVYFRFEVKGERRFPVAVSSLMAKYFRERAMKLVNRYWQSRVPNLKATAGYPVDARRFLSDIQSAIGESKLAEDQYWRLS